MAQRSGTCISGGWLITLALLAAATKPALAGPPFQSDDRSRLTLSTLRSMPSQKECPARAGKAARAELILTTGRRQICN